MESQLHHLPPAERTIIPPELGWECQTLYQVEVAFAPNNPVHPAVFYSGYLGDNGAPAGYNCVWHPSYETGDGRVSLCDTHYMKVKKVLCILP